MMAGTGAATGQPDQVAETHPTARPGAAEGVLARRERLGAATRGFADVLRAPVENPARWRAEVREALLALRQGWIEHVEESESPTGLLAQVREDAPWLAPRVDRVAREHGTLDVRIDTAIDGWDDEADPADILRELRPLLREFERHRERGTELLMDAYGLDLSAGD